MLKKLCLLGRLGWNKSEGISYQTPILTSMKLHDCEAIEIESVKKVSIGIEIVKKALRKCQETNKRFP